MRRKARVDLNQSEFVRTLQGCGLSVFDTHGVGAGFPDLVVGGWSHRHNATMCILVEVKSAGKLNRVTPDELRFEDEWRGPRMRTEDPAEVLRFFGLVE